MEEKIREEIQNNLDQMIEKNLLQGKEIIIFTCTNRTQFIIQYLKNKNIKVSAVLDNDKATTGTVLEEVTVYKPEEYLTPYNKNIMILIAHAAYTALLNQVSILGYKENQQVVRIVELSQFQHIAIDDKEFEERIKIIKLGENLFCKIANQTNKREKIFICSPLVHIGDIYITLLYFKEYIKIQNIKSFKIVCLKGVTQQVIKLFGLDNQCILLEKKEEIYRLIQYAIFTDGVNKQVEMLHPNAFYTISHFNDSTINITDGTKYLFYNLPRYIEPQVPTVIYKCKNHLEYIEELFDNYHLQKRKTIILFPYAKSVPNLKKEFWEQLVLKLNQMGFTVCTNSNGSIEEPAIKGTVAICCKLMALREFVEEAGYIIALRSGICDLISAANAKKIVIYPYQDVRKIWSFKELEIGNDIYELNMRHEKVTFNQILKIIEGEET